MNEKIKVLIIDDSLFFREILAKGIDKDPSIEVIAKVSNPIDAQDKILELKPDVVTCDVEMPRMNGINFIKQLLPKHQVPIIVISQVSEAVFDAMDAGAVDFMNKPNVKSTKDIEDFMKELIRKIKIASKAKMVQVPCSSCQNMKSSTQMDIQRVVAIGASTGGTEAIAKLLKQFPSTMPGIVITQHIPPKFSKMFADRLNSQTHFLVKEAVAGEYIEAGKVLIAPGDQHMTVKKIGDRYKVQVAHGEKVNRHCPSVDVLFESVATECGKDAVGIILTGMGGDGAKGLLSMRKNGARTIGQDEGTCVVYGMPKVAFEIGAVEKQAPLQDIPAIVCTLLQKK